MTLKYKYQLPNSQINILKELLRKQGLSWEQIRKRVGNFNQKIDDEIERLELTKSLTTQQKKQIFDEEFRKMRESTD